MPLHECSHRRVTVDKASGPGRLVCGLAQQVLGLETDTECQIEESVCANCGKLPPPTTAAPNSVVASVIWNSAARILRDDLNAGVRVGKALDAQNYVLPSLEADCDSDCPIAAQYPADDTQKASDVGQRANRAGARPAFSARVGLSPTASPMAARTARRACVGLVGYNTASGLGYLSRDLAVHEVADRWLVISHPRLRALKLPASSCTIDVAPQEESPANLSQWLRTLDWVLFAETSHFDSLPRLAREAGVRVALIPMWEWMAPSAEWLRCVDLLICPTRHSQGVFLEWKARFGFTWDVEYIAWPVATGRFRFRQRGECRRFVFINGTGGARAQGLDRTPMNVRRKGLDVILAAAHLAPEIPWIVFSQSQDRRHWPRNVLVQGPPSDNAALYDDGDVCVQPSRWEGLGLQLLECQAAGLPLVTTDAPPMNEYQPLRRIHPRSWEWGFVHGGQPVHIPVFDPPALAGLVREMYGTDLSAASVAARRFVERQHNWDQAAPALRRLFDSRTCERTA